MAAFLNCLFTGCYAIPSSIIAWLRSCRGGGGAAAGTGNGHTNGHLIPARVSPHEDDERDLSSIPLERKTEAMVVTVGGVAGGDNDNNKDVQLEEDLEDSNALVRWWTNSSVRAAMSKMMMMTPPSSSQPLDGARHAEDLGLIDLDDDDEDDVEDENSHLNK